MEFGSYAELNSPLYGSRRSLKYRQDRGVCFCSETSSKFTQTVKLLTCNWEVLGWNPYGIPTALTDFSFADFLSYSGEMPEYHHGNFLSNPFQLIIRNYTLNCTMWSQSHWKLMYINYKGSRDSSVGIVTGCDSRQVQEIFLFSTASRPDLEPTQLPI
jgi:hypothetical protein